MDSIYLTECAADNRTLGKLLEPVLKDSFTVENGRRKRTGPLQILDLACGPCREVQVITDSLRNAVPGGSRDVRFVGADIRGAQIDEARERARHLASPDFHPEFLNADCSTLRQHRGLGASFDMVFLRHQNFWDHPTAWRRIFEAGLERLQENGLMVITSYFDREHFLATKAILKSGARLITSVKNPYSRHLGTPGKSVDRHIAVFRRPGQPET